MPGTVLTTESLTIPSDSLMIFTLQMSALGHREVK